MKKLLLGLILLATIFILALPTILHKAGLHPEYQGASYKLPAKRALVITTSHNVLSDPRETGDIKEGKETGVMASEMTHPYYTFLDGGMDVDIASIKGGAIPVDPQTLQYMVISPEDKRYLEDDVLQAKVNNSIAIDQVDISQYDIVFIAGGWGAAYDLAQSPALAAKISTAYYSDKNPILGSVCHGALAFVNVKDQQGNLLIAGRRMTGVSDKQIKELGIELTPLHPETELRKAGVEYESQTAFRDLFATHVVIDDERRFVTGQNQNSGLETANKMMGILAQRFDASINLK